MKFGVWTVARVLEMLWWGSLEYKIWLWLPFGISLATRTSLWNVGASCAGSDRMRKLALGIFFFGVGGEVVT